MSQQAHLLTITETGKDWTWRVDCPFPGELATRRQVCGTWVECEHEMTDDAREQMENDGGGECPESETGGHIDLEGNPHQPSRWCWVQVHDYTPELIDDIRSAHGAGVFVVQVTANDYDHLQLDVVAVVAPDAEERAA